MVNQAAWNDIYASWEKKVNPQNITAATHDNPHHSAASAMPLNITPTVKPQGTSGSRDSASAIPETSIPSASSATDIIATVQSERADEFGHTEIKK